MIRKIRQYIELFLNDFGKVMYEWFVIIMVVLAITQMVELIISLF